MLSLAVLVATWLQFEPSAVVPPRCRNLFDFRWGNPRHRIRLINTCASINIPQRRLPGGISRPSRLYPIVCIQSLILFPERTPGSAGTMEDTPRWITNLQRDAPKYGPRLCSDVCNVDVDRPKRCRRLRIPPVMSSFTDRCRRYAMLNRRQGLMSRGRGRRRRW